MDGEKWWFNYAIEKHDSLKVAHYSWFGEILIASCGCLANISPCLDNLSKDVLSSMSFLTYLHVSAATL